MPQLANRQRQIPFGLKFYEPRTKWASRPGSFQNIVDQVIAHRKANAWLSLPTDAPTVSNEVDKFNAALCQAQGWNEFIVEGNPNPPMPPPPSLGQRLLNVAGASPVIVEWLASGAEAVPVEKANARAAVCAKCPLNEKGDWLRFFTVAASEAIRQALKLRSDWNLSTPDDFRLGVCNACDCPLRLKIHMPIERIRKNLKPEQVSRLHQSCWIPTE